MPIINLIVCVDTNNGIGFENKLLFTVPEDLKFFKSITNKHAIVMGRKTYQSLPCTLPHRLHVVLTSDGAGLHNDIVLKNNKCKTVHGENALVGVCTLGSKQELIDIIDDIGDQVFIIGGATLYEQFEDIATNAYITVIDSKAENVDAYFPELKSFTDSDSELLEEGTSVSGLNYKIMKVSKKKPISFDNVYDFETKSKITFGKALSLCK